MLRPLASSNPLLRSPALRLIEQAAIDLPLMERAGAAAADLAADLCTDREAPILVVAGPGNNGGDAFVAARRLRAMSRIVDVVFIGEPERLPTDARKAWEAWTAAGGQSTREMPKRRRWGLIIDGLFGIGLTRAVGGEAAELIDRMNVAAAASACPLLALDCPSGLDADTGSLRGTCVQASDTLTFIALKPGLLTADGPDHCGTVHLASLGLDLRAQLQTQQPGAEGSGATVGRDLFVDHLKRRPRNSHKGSFGAAGVIGGNASMVGAAILAGRAALKLGAGRVYLGLVDRQAPTFDAQQPELMLRDAEAIFAAPLSAAACGPGLGTDDAAIAALQRALGLPLPLLLDADALNLVAADARLAEAVRCRSAPTVLTPHPTEAARLLGRTTAAVQADRIACARTLAQDFAACVALKGCGTVVATPDGQWFVNVSGNPGLASAGTGDVLSGMTVSLLAQGWPPAAALQAAVHLHGAAAEVLATEHGGEVGLTASELGDAARRIFNRWLIGD